MGGLVERIKNESVCKIRKLYGGRQIKNELFFITPAAAVGHKSKGQVALRYCGF